MIVVKVGTEGLMGEVIGIRRRKIHSSGIRRNLRIKTR